MYAISVQVPNIKEIRDTEGLVTAFLEMLLVLSTGLAEEGRFQPLDERQSNEGLKFTELNRFRSWSRERRHKHVA